MPPKTEKILQDTFNKKVEEIQKAFNDATDKLKKSFEDEITKLLGKISSQENEIKGLKAKNMALEVKIDDLEQKNISNSLVLSGELIKNALKVVPNEVASKSKHAAEYVLHEKLNIPSEECKIIKAYKMKNKESPSNANNTADDMTIVVELKDHESKNSIFKNIIKRKTKEIYVNELLTGRRREILKRILQTRKTSKKFLQVYTYDGIIHVRKQKEARTERIINTNDMENVMKYLIE